METLPYSWYSDPAIYRLEQERIFRRTWQYVGHVGQLPARGSYVGARAGDVPVLVVRGRDLELRAFLNVCRHRGAVLVDGEGRRETIQCPYHAWTYDLDGALRRAPRGDELEADQDELALVPLPLDTWGPFVFVNADPEAPPLAETLGDLPALVAAAGIDVDALVFHHRAESRHEANWKICCENYLECYHCAVAHPGFAAVVDVSPERYRLEGTSALLATQYGPLREDGSRSSFDARGEVDRGQFHLLWPNLTINVMPGRPNLSIGPIIPDGPERTSRFLDYFFAADADAAWIDELVAWDGEVGEEDRRLVERVQRGVRSGVVDKGVLLPEAERLVGRFDELVTRSLA